MIRRIAAVVGLVLFLGAFALLADFVLRLDDAPPSGPSPTVPPAAEPGS